MKKLALLALGLLSITASASNLKLYDRETCMRAYIECKAPAKFLHDSDGRCGCLTERDYFPLKACVVSFIACPEDQPLSHLKDMDGRIVGCGCYATR